MSCTVGGGGRWTGSCARITSRAIRRLLDQLNDRPFQKLKGSRRSLFESLERPMLLPLPEQRYEFARWKKARVNIDYHIDVDGHYYSVPHTFTGEGVGPSAGRIVILAFARAADEIALDVVARVSSKVDEDPVRVILFSDDPSVAVLTRFAGKGVAVLSTSYAEWMSLVNCI